MEKEKVTREEAINAYSVVLKYLSKGESEVRPDMLKTPMRYIKMMEELTSPEPFEWTCFDNEDDDAGMIIQGPINIQSLCAHHTAIFRGVAYVAYIPDKKIVGLSKLARCARNAGKRFGTQEEITIAIANEIQENLHPKGVAVQLRMSHDCMSARGVKAPEAQTVTTKLLGAFLEDKPRKEFLSAISNP